MTFLWPHFKGNVCVPFNFLLTKKKKKKAHSPESCKYPRKPVNHEILQTEICLGRRESNFQQTAFVSDVPIPVSARQRVMPGYTCLVGLK